MSDPGKYREKKEVDHMKEHFDPISQVRTYLEGKEDAQRLKAVEGKVKEIVLDAATFAQSSPLPETQELYTDVLL